MKKYGIGAVFILVIIGLMVVGKKHTPTSSPVAQDTAAATTSQLPGLQTGALPWGTTTNYLKQRLASIGLPALTAEGSAVHTHQHIDISIDGAIAPVPSGIGINELAGFISPIHVHDLTGIIHVESPTVQTFTLGQFFDIWGVRFSSTCIGGYCADANKSLKVYINGVLYQGNPRDITLVPHQEFFIYFGTDADLPTTIPSTFTFPSGY